MTGKNNNIVELRGISFSFSKQTIFHDLDLDICRGDFIGLIGPNGSGKTTLLKLIVGLLAPDSGSVKLFGEGISSFKRKYLIGYVPQKATNFDPSFPAIVFEVVCMGRYARIGMGRGLSKQDYEIIERSLSLVGMSKYRNRRIGDLSGGQQQKVFIARALAGEPELLLLDEPTVGVDAKSQADFYDMLNEMNSSLGVTLLIVSHDIGVVSKQVGKIACLNHRISIHESKKGFKESELMCAYHADVKKVIHDHDR